jgi:hypothetical protein
MTNGIEKRDAKHWKISRSGVPDQPTKMLKFTAQRDTIGIKRASKP